MDALSADSPSSVIEIYNVFIIRTKIKINRFQQLLFVAVSALVHRGSKKVVKQACYHQSIVSKFAWIS